MAVLHPATIRPTKLEALQAWVPAQPWLDGADASQLELLGAYRLDDPDGEVGLEAHLLATTDGRVLHVPVTYRGAPLDGADDALITTMEHTALGQRWVYDGCADPVFLAAYREAITAGGRQADQFVATDTGLVPREATAHVRGTGTGAGDGGGELTVLRFPRPGAEPLALTGTWAGQDTPLVLAVLSA
ncbi:hypothetical protein [Quadrisphaera sp. INWT6]|uniref:CG0192-related protein n=1 Tax=Quadrisphaera sp. INWT6 TaxID=2596917 RepID=UPI0018927F33|nr:hypothetical protein [Quadrisphaera sp. INWT6]MBF5082718.1 hypothetical protein [Quadrisphaera sp. INWT6]